MVDYENASLFQQDSLDKQMVITIAGMTDTIKNDDIKLDSFTLIESLCSDSTITFGKCESCHVEFELRKDFPSINGKELSIVITPEGGEEFPLGKYTVISETPQSNSNYKKVIAYDKMYFINTANITDWWNDLPNRAYVSSARNLFFELFGIEQESVSLWIDDWQIPKTIRQTNLSGADFLRSLCELSGVFGHIGRDGKFRYVKLDMAQNRLYPAVDLFPSDSIIPNQRAKTTVSTSLYESVEYENYKSKAIDSVALESSEGTVVKGNTTANTYHVKSNLLIAETSSYIAGYFAEHLLGEIKDIEYKPIKKLSAKGNPCIEVGDYVNVNDTEDVTVNSFVLTRTMTGIVALSDDVVSKGTEEQPAVTVQTKQQQQQQQIRTEQKIENMQSQMLKIQWVSSSSAVGSDPYTFYCIKK